MIRLFVCVMLVASVAVVNGEDLTTHYERSGYRETPRYGPTVDYCRQLSYQ